MKNKNKVISKDAKPKAKKNQGFWLWQFLSSVKLAVVVLFLVAVSCVLGTFILQGRTPQEYVARYGDGWGNFLQTVQFTKVFSAIWFYILLSMLCLNLLVCALKRWRNTILQFGFLATHLSLILIMIGSMVDGIYGRKGAINLLEGQKVQHFYTYDGMKKIPMEFELLLDDFELVKHEPKFELIAYVKKKDKERKISTKVGVVQKVVSSPYKVTVKKYIPDAELKREPINTAKELKNPAVFVQFLNLGRMDSEGWLLAQHRNWYEPLGKGLRIEYVWTKTDEERQKVVSSEIKDDSSENKKEGLLVVNLKDRDRSLEYPFRIGEHYNVGNSEYHIQILEYVGDFSNRQLPIDQQTNDNPAAKIEIHGPDGNEERWLFANYPEWDEMHETKYKNINLLFKAPGSVPGMKHLIRIVQDSNGENVLLYYLDKKKVEEKKWELDKIYNVGDSGYQIKLTKYFQSFGFREEVVQRSDTPNNPAIFVETSGPSGMVSEWLFAKEKRAWWYDDENLALLYQEEREMIKDFKSKLSVLVDGEVVKTKVIEVNDPLSYGGLDFYQANYDPNNPKFSGIQISSHPGIPIVYSGFIILCIGIVFIFYIKPFIKKSRQKKRKEMAHA